VTSSRFSAARRHGRLQRGRSRVDADTLFRIGSTTKTFTATAMMRLVDQGRVDLTAPARKVLPDLKLADEAVAKSVTV
jgi:CubicO group peptidase (beta-lactamase class C family)